MDDVQGDHLKAYGVAYRVVQAGIKAEWLLNYRGGSFLVPDGAAIRRDAALNGVGVEAGGGGPGTPIRGGNEGAKADAGPLQETPQGAVDVPPHPAPRDGAG